MDNILRSMIRTVVLGIAIAGIIPSAAQVLVSSPPNNSQISSPVHYIASAASPKCSKGIIDMRIYLAPHVVAYNVHSSALDTHLSLTPGTYKTVVQAWDACGGVGKTPVNFTVKAPGLKPVRFVYVSAAASNFIPQVFGFVANPTNGSLSPTPQASVLPVNRIGALAADKGGYRLYATDGSAVYAYFIDRRNGNLSAVPGSPLPTSPWSAVALAVHPSGKLVFVGGDSGSASAIQVFSVNSDGSLTAAAGGPISTTAPVAKLIADPSGKYLYALTGVDTIPPPFSIEAFVIDTNSGALTPVPGSPYSIPTPVCSGQPKDMTDLYGRFLYAAGSNDSSISGFGISGKTGTLHDLSWSPLQLGSDCRIGQELVVSEPTGRFFYVVDTFGNFNEFSINAGNGALRQVSGVSPTFGNARSPVSDPSGMFIYYTSNTTQTIIGTGQLVNIGYVGAFAIDPVNGTLRTPFFPENFGNFSTAGVVAVTP
jgi:6-phosphogluconolactonase (cycloisomerase 2 family)